MSGVNGGKPDLKDMITTKAEELAEQRYGREFNDLPASLQMKVWMEAEQEAADYFACQADAIYDRMREDGLNHRRDGHDHWNELELQRRLGK